MAQRIINPLFNVYKKYRQMQFVNPYRFGIPEVVYVNNTFIGGVASAINTPAQLATKLAIDVSRITNFSIVGNDIECKITGSYVIPNNAFYLNEDITEYRDIDNLVTNLGSDTFYTTINSRLKILQFNGIVNLTNINITYNSPIREIYLENCVFLANQSLWGASQKNKTYIYIPKCTSLGTTAGDNNIFTNSLLTGSIIICHPSLATNNAGGVDGDISNAIAQGATIRYKTSTIIPNAVTDLTASNIYQNAVQFTFTAPIGSTNAIDFYELYKDGVYVKRIVSGETVNGFNASTAYNFTVIARDIFYNGSLASNVVSVTTAYNTNKVEAETYITATANVDSAQIAAINNLTLTLKNNGIFFKLKSLNIKVGGTAATHKFNLIDARDLDAAYRYTYAGTWTHSAQGAKPTATFANTYLNLTTLGLGGNFSFGYYLTVANTAFGDKHGFGAYSSASSWAGSVHYSTTELWARAYSASFPITITSPNNGFFAMSVIGRENTVYHKNLKLHKSVVGSLIPTVNFYEGALNLNGSNYGGINGTYGTSFFGIGLTDAEIANLQAAIITFETALGRNV